MTAALAAPRPSAPRADHPATHPATHPAAAPCPQLDRSAPVLTRRSGAVQVGWSAERAVILTPPEGAGAAPLVALLAALDGARTLTELRPHAERAGLDDDATRVLLHELAVHHLLRWVPRPGAAPTARVVLHGRGPLCDALEPVLLAAGTVVHRSTRRALVLPPGLTVDLVLLADALVPETRLVSGVLADGVPHLVVRLRDGSGLVGPLVLPGRTSCLRCADLHRRDRDPEWPLLAAQLTGRCGSGGPAVVRATAALAAAQVQAVLEGTRPGGSGTGAPAALGATLELDPVAGTLLRRQWSPHPGCGCGAHP